MAKEDDNNIEDDKEGAPETDTEEDGQVTPPPRSPFDRSLLIPVLLAYLHHFLICDPKYL